MHLCQALKSDVDIAIYDAANITRNRRRWLVDQVSVMDGVHVNTIFVESICHDQAIIAVRETA